MKQTLRKNRALSKDKIVEYYVLSQSHRYCKVASL